MKVVKKWTDLRREAPHIAVALGMFDGVHRGHQVIIKRAVDLAREIGGRSAVFTFSNHPLSVLAPASCPRQIGTVRLKEMLIEKLGVDYLLCVPFSEQLSQQRPEDFLRTLQSYLAPQYVVTGPDFTFGYKGKGTRKMLLRDGALYGFQAEICESVRDGGTQVSSTRIRAALDEGRLGEANELLGYPFTYIGSVVHGDRRGRTLGFPTANLQIPDTAAMLPDGVYLAAAVVGGREYMALANIGSNPTFNGKTRRIEVNLRDFDGDIYDKLLEVRFLLHLRGQEKFGSADALVTQMRKDLQKAEAHWKKKDFPVF